jgi:hypothetical protein
MNERIRLSEIVKAEIAKSLANFLLSEKNIPQEITIHVGYKETLAKLHVNLDGINKALSGQK